MECDYCNIITVTSCEFSWNIAHRSAGVFDFNYGNISIYNTSFISNLAFDSHGVIYIRYGSASIVLSNFGNNHSAQRHTRVLEISLNINYTTFTNNTAARYGGVIYINEETNASISSWWCFPQ